MRPFPDLVNEAKNKRFKAADALVLLSFKIGWKMKWWWTCDKTCSNHVTARNEWNFKLAKTFILKMSCSKESYFFDSLEIELFVTWAEVARLLDKSEKEDWEHGILHRDVWVDVSNMGHQVGQGPVVTTYIGATRERENRILVMKVEWIPCRMWKHQLIIAVPESQLSCYRDSLPRVPGNSQFLSDYL